MHPCNLQILDNEIAEANYKQNNEVPIKMSTSEKLNTTMIGEPTKRGMH
jgi:hypothetical protein